MDFSTIQSRLIQLPKPAKRAIVMLCDAGVLVLSLTLTLLTRHQVSFPSNPAVMWLFPAALLVGIPVLASQGLYRAIIRFVNARIVTGVLRALLTLSAALTALAGVLAIETGVELASFALVFYVFGVSGLIGSRFVMRALVSDRHAIGERVAIYGAGRAGLRLVAAASDHREFVPVLFIDDNPELQGRTIAGLPVVSPATAADRLDSLGVDRVLLAMPSASRHRRKQIIDGFSGQSVRLQTVPDIGDLVTGKARLDELRDVGVADILGRDPVAPVPRLLDACIRGKCVMVTGAGGSIGSELCRQIVELGATRLVLFEVSELALYQVERELRERIRGQRLDVELVALIGSVDNRGRLRQIVQGFGVQTIYHAAAYKHVPIVEFNMAEGVRNNVIGTWHAAEVADEAGVEHFVLVSTDKAVRPTNIMGATKRMAEMVLQGMTSRGSHTRFCMVRFGNVLESSGSVVPLFREQIRRGGPVTVTDPDVTRYFMTIPEAAQLVLQAGAMGQGGEVFLLDMGEPVRIVDLARRMIQLMGLSVRDRDCPDGDIVIRFTGLRPGEKLYEELLISGDADATAHPKILCAHEKSLPWSRVQEVLDTLMAAADEGDCDAIRRVLLEVVQDYRPADGQIADLSWQHRPVAPPEPAAQAKVSVA